VLELVGVEGFEGLLQYREPGRREASVRDFIAFLVEIAEELDRRDLLDGGDVLLTAGGSAFYDLVTEGLAAARLKRAARVVLRSGCYLTHDHGLYDNLLQDLQRRTGSATLQFEPALEVWGQVLSAPESELVILSAGRRDFGQDAGNPIPIKYVRRGTSEPRRFAPSEADIVGVSDQHAHIRIARGHAIGVGDLIALGLSHPCTTFDKWRVIFLVDDYYNVVDAIRTYF
jgi:D-serine dehydratase